MVKKLSLVILFSSTQFFISCTKQGQQEKSIISKIESSPIKYATGFQIEYNDHYKKLIVPEPFKGAHSPLVYYLYEKDDPSIPRDGLKIKIPVKTIVCSSTTHLPALAMLNEEDALVGFPSLKYVSTPTILERIEKGKVRELGTENGMDLEGIVELQPDLMMGYLMTNDSKQYEKITKAGIPVVINADYLEESPLGRAEWIRFTAAFFNLEDQADSIFNAIEKNYNEIKNIALSETKRPTVFSGIVYGSTWYMPGGKSWAGIYFRDAGGNFLWSDNDDNGSLELSFETVLEKAKDADYWIGASNFDSKEALAESDERYKLFKAFQTNEIYTYTLKVNNHGGNDFFENGFAHPDQILSDMVKILHPDLLGEKAFNYFQKLN